MHTPTPTHDAGTLREDEFVTIVAPTIGAVMQQFRDSELGAKGYCIAGRVVRRAFKFADGAQNVDMFDGAEMVAATFARQRV